MSYVHSTLRPERDNPARARALNLSAFTAATDPVEPTGRSRGPGTADAVVAVAPAVLVEISGTIQAPDGSYERVSVQGETYEAAREVLIEKLPEEHKLLVIRTDR